MEILYLLIPVSLVIVALAVGVFFWAVRSGQYDDMEGPAWRILYDDEPSRAPKEDDDHPEGTGPTPR
jgi:cbb3-type cytochrome oxidase maturation protein